MGHAGIIASFSKRNYVVLLHTNQRSVFYLTRSHRNLSNRNIPLRSNNLISKVLCGRLKISTEQLSPENPPPPRNWKHFTPKSFSLVHPNSGRSLPRKVPPSRKILSGKLSKLKFFVIHYINIGLKRTKVILLCFSLTVDWLHQARMRSP